MRAVLVEAPDRIAVRDVEPPRPDGGTLVRVQRAGLCGTDLKIVAGTVPVSYPRLLGHEIVGRVQETGRPQPAANRRLRTGDRVLVNPSLFCGRCRLCRADRMHLCPHGALLGRDVDGGFCDLISVDEAHLHPIPESIADDPAVVLQVFATCVHAQRLVQVFPGQAAVVVGLGVAGLLHLQLLRARGITTVVGVTRSSWKRDLARRLGAVEVATPETAQAVVEAVTGGRGADLTVECAGVPQALRQAMLLAGVGGTVLVFGTTAPTADAMPTYEWYFRELAIINARAARPRDYDRAIELAASGDIVLEPLISGSYDITAAEQAFAACRDPDQLKVILQMSDGGEPSS